MILLGRTDSNLFAIAFKPILTSKLMRGEIGRQLDMSLLSLSFFSSNVIIDYSVCSVIRHDRKHN